MKLAHPELGFIIDITESRFPVLVLEQPGTYYHLISQLCAQTEGAAGQFVLSEDWEPLDIGKAVFLLTDLFHIELNGRRQTTALSKCINALAVSEKHIKSTLELQEKILMWALSIEDDLPFVTIHNDTLDVASILKTVGIRFDDSMQDISERLCSLIKISAGYLNVRLLAVVGLHTCVEKDAIREIYKTAMYEKVAILDIERYVPETVLPCEKLYIIDKDKCEIYNDEER